ncbi:50S ribosomal protein L22 [Mycoplasma sp. (ex Biomphalaria glabrata)]|uniref:50S ribosomal protein L22 n=1 Tax=Mycoplasma sp. (ex Biomphalaria glabrata) TaxID=1749074 RepID=UPI00073A6F06|nr:50S ribosomal protein L22 [Mycoplasma sp. (ex Biomphalaria glabrata)]ALV23393.1 50S ribosomal protein L22 [Mycoplasma sp. (ex Biomphalaria glabrata)]
MEAKAFVSKIRITPRKMRLVVDLVRNKSVNEASLILKNTDKSGAYVVSKLLKSAIANAVNNQGMKADELVISSIMVGDGPTLKRMHPRARGRSGAILKRSCNINITLSDNKGQE